METHEYDYGVDDYEYAQELCARHWDLTTDWETLAFHCYYPEED